MRAAIPVMLVIVGVVLVVLGVLAGTYAPEPRLEPETAVERFGRAAGPWLTPGTILVVGGLIVAALDERSGD